MNAPIGALPAGSWRPLLRAEIQDLRDALRDHFAREEEGGYLSEILDKQPNLQRRAESLRIDHDRLRDITGALAHSVIESEFDIDGVRAALRDALGMLREHEIKESELIQDACLRDIGCGD